MGLHAGTVEWLPGSPLGNSGFSWSDVLMSSTPNMYIYAANNPSESIIAKRRGYGTIISHNVPPYGRAGGLHMPHAFSPSLFDCSSTSRPRVGRVIGNPSASEGRGLCAGLYKQLAELQGLLQEFRSDPQGNSNLKESIVSTLTTSGLQKDCPFVSSAEGAVEMELTTENVAEVLQADFEAYCSKLYGYDAKRLCQNRSYRTPPHCIAYVAICVSLLCLRTRAKAMFELGAGICKRSATGCSVKDCMLLAGSPQQMVYSSTCKPIWTAGYLIACFRPSVTAPQPSWTNYPA